MALLGTTRVRVKQSAFRGRLALACIIALFLALHGARAVAQTTFSAKGYKFVFGTTSTGAHQFIETSFFVAVPGAVASFQTGGTGTDTAVVTFSAPCKLESGTDGQDWLAIEARLDGVAMNPASGVDFAFCSDPVVTSSSQTWVREAATNTFHTVQIFGRAVDSGSPNSLSAQLNSWTLVIKVAD